MKFIAFGGAALAALFIGSAALAQDAPKQAHKRASFFNSNELRSDVPGHVDKMFKRLDLNQDGYISKDEVAASQAQYEERMEKSAPKRAARLFERLDANHDGKITLAEVEAAHAARAARSGARARPASVSRRPGSSTLFARADANQDGVLTRAEFDAALAAGKIKTRHANMRGSSIVRLFDDADTNRDGRVSLAEARAIALKHFDDADLNHDGTLTPDERRQAAKLARAKNRKS